MAKKSIKANITIITITLLLIAKSSEQGDCTASILSLAPCIDYVTGSSSAPSAECCLKFSTVVISEPTCLCLIINGGSSQFGMKVNQTRALALPGECNVHTPPFSRCNAAVPSPSISPSGGGNSNGGDSAGSFLKAMSLPAVVSVATIVIAYLSKFP